MSAPQFVAAQHAWHEHDLRWRCGCSPKHSINNHGCTGHGYRHTEPFHQCAECLANLHLNGLTGAAVARTMREYTEVPHA